MDRSSKRLETSSPEYSIVEGVALCLLFHSSTNFAVEVPVSSCVVFPAISSSLEILEFFGTTKTKGLVAIGIEYRYLLALS